MTHVYMVSRWFGEDDFLLGIFSTREKALSCYVQAVKEEPGYTHDIEMVPLDSAYSDRTWQIIGVETVRP